LIRDWEILVFVNLFYFILMIGLSPICVVDDYVGPLWSFELVL